MARYDTRPWRWTSSRTCASISSKFTMPPPPVRIPAVRTDMLTEGWSSYEHTVALRASSKNVHLFGRVFYTRFGLEKQWGSFVSRPTLFRTPLMEPAAYGVHRTHRLSALQTVPHRQRIADPLRPDRRRAGVYHDACARKGPATD